MGDEQTACATTSSSTARARRSTRHRLHGRRRGGVRAPRPGDARARQPLRGGPGGRAGHGARAAPRRRADRVRGRGQDRPLRDVRRDRRPRWPSAARSSSRSSSRSGSRSARPGRIRGPLAGPADHRHAALPPQRRDPPLRRLAQQHLRPPRPRRHPRRRPRDRRHERAAQLPARAARALGELAVRRERRTPACTRRGRRSSRASSRAAASRTRSTSGSEFEDYVRFLYETGSITEHTQLWWSVRPHLALPDGRDPHLRRPARPGRGAVARRVRARRSRRGSRVRIDEGEPLARPAAPADRGEHVARDPLRPLGRADRPRARRRPCPRGRGSSG